MGNEKEKALNTQENKRYQGKDRKPVKKEGNNVILVKEGEITRNNDNLGFKITKEADQIISHDAEVPLSQSQIPDFTPNLDYQETQPQRRGRAFKDEGESSEDIDHHEE